MKNKYLKPPTYPLPESFNGIEVESDNFEITIGIEKRIYFEPKYLYREWLDFNEMDELIEIYLKFRDQKNEE